jgi:hypothetical protein
VIRRAALVDQIPTYTTIAARARGDRHEGDARAHAYAIQQADTNGCNALAHEQSPMTVEGAQRLKVELHRLKTVERPSVDPGDRGSALARRPSENADYDAAKERQGFIEGRISDIESKLANAQVIDPTRSTCRTSCFGATVELEDARAASA